MQADSTGHFSKCGCTNIVF